MNANEHKTITSLGGAWLIASIVLAIGLLVGSCFTALSQTTNSVSTEVLLNKPPQNFYWIDTRKLSFPQQLQLSSLQALANSNAPVLFGIWRKDDLSWLSAMEKQLGKTSEPISFDDALARFSANAPQVIWDPSRGWTLSIATTLAGMHGALLTNQKIKGHEVAFDCHNRWTNKFEAYRWAVAELLPKCDQSRLVYLDEVLPTMRDYAIQQNLFVLNLDPLNDPKEIKLLEEILSKFPAQTRVFGWASPAYARKKGQDGVTVENALVSRLSRRGMMLVPTDFGGNFSFFVQTQPSVGKLAQRRLNRDIKFETGKRYVLLVVSDGDNLQYDLGVMRAHWEMERPKIPIAWSISPQLQEVGPAVLQTYYREAAERGGWDEFVAGPSGYAYVNPGNMTTTHLRGFVESTRKACKNADITSIVILDDGSRPFAQVATFLNAYASADFDGLWLAAMPRNLGAVKDTAFLNEQFRLGRDNAAETALQVGSMDINKPFVMVYVNGWDNVGTVVQDFSHGLNNSSVIVSPTEMAKLIRQWASAYANIHEISTRPDFSQGLFPVNAEDGKFTIVDHQQVRCWLVPKDAYLYLDVDERFRRGLIEIDLEYFDSGSGGIKLEYDSTDIRAPFGGVYKTYPYAIHLKNSGQWQLGRFRVNDARFRDSQNNHSDFRFRLDGRDMLIRAVRVRHVGI